MVHTVGPVWTASEDRSGLLRSCYVESLRVAAELGARSVAFPAISTGIYGWPLDDGARQALSAVSAADTEVDEARFVLFGPDALDAFRRAAADLGLRS